MKRILVTGAGGPPGVNFINSLRYSKEKMYIVGTDIDKMHLEWPNVDKAYLSPCRADNPKYLYFLNNLIEKENIEFVHGQPDQECSFLSQNRNKIKAKTFLPNKKTVEICQNKFKSAKIWLKKGIYKYNTYIINNKEDLKKASKELGYPFWMRAAQGAGARGSTLVENIDIGYYWLKYWQARNIGWIFIAQKYFEGRDFAFQSLWKDGKLITSQARERLEYIYAFLSPSLHTGTPVIAKTVHDDRINEVSTKAILAVDKKATGIFCVDLKEDITDGNIYCTEINPARFFTTSFFFTKAGCNMPYYYVKMAYGEELPELKLYNALDKDIYYLRHIDCPTKLIKGEKWKAIV